MADKEILDLATATTLNPTDWFHIKQGSSDKKIVIGDILTAHIGSVNPHGVTKAQVGLSDVINAAQLTRANNLSDVISASTARTNLDVYSKSETTAQVTNHSNLVNNPHSVTKAQVGLANVENYTTTNNPREDTETKYATAKAVATLAGEVDVMGTKLLPKGAIIMWSPLTGPIPTGFALCNGQTIGGIVTPNLVGKFIKATTLENAGVLGGASTVAHTHSGSASGHQLTIAELPPHKHSINTRTFGNLSGAFDTQRVGQGSDGSTYVREEVINETGGGAPHSHILAVDTTSIEINPEHYTLAFIIKYT